MFGLLLALIATPAVQVGTFIVGFVPGAAAFVHMFKGKKDKTSKPTYMKVRITAYGYLDNSPPGTQIALPVLHKEAGGTGTYTNPVTCASDQRQIEKGGILYIPRFQKYFIVEDICGSAVSQDRDKPPIIDIWIGGSKNSDKAKLNAKEEEYTSDTSETIILYPVNTLTVNATPLFKD